jgi:hypothetical protein
MTIKMKKYTKLIFKILVSAVFLFWIIFKVDWRNVVENVSNLNIFYLFFYIIVVVLGIAISSYKWKVLANFKGIQLSFLEFFKFYLTGTFINNFMPSFVGGDTFKAYETGKAQGKYIESASSVFMDRITGLFGATILALIFSLLNIIKVIDSKVLIIVNIIIFLSFLTDIFIAKVRKYTFWSRFGKYFPDKVVAFVADLGTYNNNSKIFRKTILLTFVFDFVGLALANYILFLAFGIQIGILDYLSVIFLISIVSSVPISINNIGIKEWAYITFFGVFGLSSSAVITVAITSRMIQMLISFFALPIYLRRSKKI